MRLNSTLKICRLISRSTHFRFFCSKKQIPVLLHRASYSPRHYGSQILFCWECADHFTKQHAFEEHQKRGCNNNDFKPGIEISEEDIIFHKWNKLGRIPVFIVYDSETIQQRLASGPVLSKPRLSIQQFHKEHPELIGEKTIREAYQQYLFNEPLVPDIRTIPVTESNAQFSHEAFLFPILLWTTHPELLPDSLFPNLGASRFDIAQLGVVSWKTEWGGLWVFYGSNCIEQGINLLNKINNEFIQKIKYYGKRKNEDGEWKATTKIDMSPEDEIQHKEATHCYLCGKEFLCPPSCQGCNHCNDIGGKVRDHDHLLKKNNYRGPAHYKCNINYRQDRFRVPVLAHNAFRFDFQLILKELSKHSYPENKQKDQYVPELKPIAKSENDYVSVQDSKDDSFLDTLHYMKASLDEMTNTYMNRTQNEDGSWNITEEKPENFVLKKAALPVIYQDLKQEEIDNIKIQKTLMFYQNFQL